MNLLKLNFLAVLMLLTATFVCGRSMDANTALGLGHRKIKKRGDDIYIEINQQNKWSLFGFQISKVRLEVQGLSSYVDTVGCRYAKDASKEFVTDQAKVLEHKVDDVVHILDDSSKEAENKGIDISDCVTEQMHSLKGIPTEATNRMKVCVEDQVTKMETYLSDLKISINTGWDEIAAMIAKYDECANSPESAKKAYCLSALSNKIDRALEEMPKKVAHASAEAQAYILNFKESFLPLCTTDKLPEVSAESETMIEQIAACLKQKYPQIDIGKLGRSLSGGCFLRSSFLIVAIMLFVESTPVFN